MTWLTGGWYTRAHGDRLTACGFDVTIWSRMEPESAILDTLFAALSDSTRRRILVRLREAPGATTGDVAAAIGGLSRFAVMKHLEVLRRAGLVQTLPEGRRRRHYPIGPALGPVASWLREAAGA
jgi:DNA-binding transcriptional ArsR family regulator